MKKNVKLLFIIYIVSTVIFIPGMQHEHLTISVYITETNTVTSISLETYVTGVVASEMPSSFHIEALKAQAVAARTYAVAKMQSDENPEQHPQAPLCDTTHCQVYSNSKDIPDKIKETVDETASELLYYNGHVITDALYHASSGGRTENSEDIFVSAVPYLRSVDSPYEKSSSRNGHGVGMSQQGANGMANAGYNYKKILSHFYTNTTVK